MKSCLKCFKHRNIFERVIKGGFLKTVYTLSKTLRFSVCIISGVFVREAIHYQNILTFLRAKKTQYVLTIETKLVIYRSCAALNSYKLTNALSHSLANALLPESLSVSTISCLRTCDHETVTS